MTRYFAEHLNPHFGYFYTITDSIYQGRTDYQELEIVDTVQFGRVMLLDQVTQVGEKSEWLYHEPMVHPALTAHPDPRRVAVIGAGDGGIIREVLKHGSERVLHCELDGGVVEVCKKYLPSISAGCWDDPRVELRIGDGRAAIEQSEEVFDVVIMDMTDPFGPSTMLYTREFFQAIKQRLADEHGCFVMHAESSITRPHAFQQIATTLRAVWPEVHFVHLYIQMYATLWSIAIAGERDAVASTTEGILAERLQRRQVGPLSAYTPASHHAMQVGFPFIDQLLTTADQLPVITDEASTFADEIDLNISVAANDLNRRLNP